MLMERLEISRSCGVPKTALGSFSNVFSENEVFVLILKHWIFKMLIFILKQLSIDIWVWDFILFVEVSLSCFVNLLFWLNAVICWS